MSELLRSEWRKDPKGYEVVPVTRDMFDVEREEIEYDTGRKMAVTEVWKAVPRAGQPKSISRILSSGGREEIEKWMGLLWRKGTWVRDPAIETVAPHELLWIVGKSGQLDPYALPTTDFGVFREFAELSPGNEGIDDFASKYGLLVNPIAEPVILWNDVSGDMGTAVVEWQDGMRRGDLRNTAATINDRMDFRLLHSRGADVVSVPRIELDGLSRALRPALRIRVPNLYQALWLQFAQTVSNDIALRHCDRCPAWFAYGPGTGRRKKARYCSDACRKAAWNAKKLEEESGRERRPK